MYKYQAIAEKLKKKFTDGSFQPGAVLPDQEQLAVEFGTTRMTIRKAIQSLIVEGVVYTKRGSGTFLRKDFASKRDAFAPILNKPLGATTNYAGHEVTSKILELDARLPTPAEQDYLVIGPEEPVYVIRRTRYIDGKIYDYERTIMPTKIAPITRKVVARSIYQYLAKEAGIRIAGAHRKVYAIKATAEDAEGLGATIGDPVLVINQVGYTDEGEPFEYSITHLPYLTNAVVADVEIR